MQIPRNKWRIKRCKFQNKIRKQKEILEEKLLNKKRFKEKVNAEGKKRNRTRKEKKVARLKNDNKEWDDFAAEERLYKKMKKGKISKKDFDEMFYKNI